MRKSGEGDKVIPGDQVAIKECTDRLGEQPAARTSIIHSPSLRYSAHASRHRKIRTAHSLLSRHWQPSPGDEMYTQRNGIHDASRRGTAGAGHDV